MLYKRLPEKKERKLKKNDKLFCESEQIEAVKRLIGGMSEKELYAVVQQLSEMGVLP